VSTTFKDHFSGHAALYRRYRPSWPAAFFQWLAGLCDRHELAWDAGTGNGQAAVLVAEHFARVVASDASAAQIDEAEPHPKVTYTVAPAEASGLAPASVDLALSAQALHWFDHTRYYDEVRRVVRPGGVVAGLTYLHPTVSPSIDPLLREYIAHVWNDWPPERRFVDAGYANVPFPFDEIAIPSGLTLTQDLDFEGFYGYLATWSAAQRSLKRTGLDPRLAWLEPLRAAWGDPARTMTVRWPLAGRVGRV